MKLTYDYKGAAQSVGSEFLDAIATTMHSRLPNFILESGTCKGNGSTAAIISSMTRRADFRTIECNLDYAKIAADNIAKQLKRDQKVRLYNMLSIPRFLVPTGEQLARNVMTEYGDEVWVDYHPHERMQIYSQETNSNVKDDAIGTILNEWEGHCDFALLDSGGHMGFEEYSYFISKLKSDCVIALDDIHHVKHYHTYRTVVQDPKCTILAEGNEKFGWCIFKRSI